mgnify:CR=1 FL=1
MKPFALDDTFLLSKVIDDLDLDLDLDFVDLFLYSIYTNAQSSLMLFSCLFISSSASSSVYFSHLSEYGFC